jgi:hypothetical protein
MSRYWPISKSSGAKISLTPGYYGDAQAITYKKQSKTEKSFLVAGGSSGTSQERMNASNASKSVGEY